MIDCIFNGARLGDIMPNFVFLANKPQIPSAEENVTEYKVLGRDGKLYRHEGTVQEVNIPISVCIASDSDEETYHNNLSRVSAWAYKRGNMILSFTDDSGYYVVKKVEPDDHERKGLGNKNLSVITYNFVCEGFRYIKDPKASRDFSTGFPKTYVNEWYTCHPLVRLRGEGVCVITVDGKEAIRVNVGDNATIDSDLMITYREDGEVVNTITAGDYTDLWLDNGVHTIDVTEGFFVDFNARMRAIL